MERPEIKVNHQEPRPLTLCIQTNKTAIQLVLSALNNQDPRTQWNARDGFPKMPVCLEYTFGRAWHDSQRFPILLIQMKQRNEKMMTLGVLMTFYSARMMEYLLS